MSLINETKAPATYLASIVSSTRLSQSSFLNTTMLINYEYINISCENVFLLPKVSIALTLVVNANM